MITIWKYIFDDPSEIIDIEIPKNAEILSIQIQRNVPTMWIKVNTENEKEIRSFRMYGTGHKINEEEKLKYIGTFQMLEEMLVWHVFEISKGIKQ